jgi:hypothetical protein
MANWLSTGNYLVVSLSGCRPITLEKGTEKYDKVMAMLLAGASDDELKVQLDVGAKIEEYSQGTIKVDKDSGLVIIDGVEVHDTITDRIVAFCKQGLPHLPLLNFWRNVQENPSKESREHLFLFLEANKMPITHDGCFLGYKGVKKNGNGDLVDAHTGTFCNNVGAVVTMPREKVNPNRNETCSSGLHVAAFSYARGNYGTLIEVKVNPRDVVAVPNDYNNQKMRVCRYEVMGLNKGTEISVTKVPLIEKAVEGSKRRNGEKTQKQEKASIKTTAKNEHLQKIEALKTSEPGSTIEEFGKLTAGEILDITFALCIHADPNLKEMDRKNKKSIVKKCAAILKSAGFIIEE